MADNDWSLASSAGGGVNCLPNPVTPLTADADALPTALADQAVIDREDQYRYGTRRTSS